LSYPISHSSSNKISLRLSPIGLVTHSSFSVMYREMSIHPNTPTSTDAPFSTSPPPIPSFASEITFNIETERLCLFVDALDSSRSSPTSPNPHRPEAVSCFTSLFHDMPDELLNRGVEHGEEVLQISHLALASVGGSGFEQQRNVGRKRREAALFLF
jgi:hypothetical protein